MPIMEVGNMAGKKSTLYLEQAAQNLEAAQGMRGGRRPEEQKLREDAQIEALMDVALSVRQLVEEVQALRETLAKAGVEIISASGEGELTTAEMDALAERLRMMPVGGKDEEA